MALRNLNDYAVTPGGKVIKYVLPDVLVTANNGRSDWENRNRFLAYRGRLYMNLGRLEAAPVAKGLAALTMAPAFMASGPALGFSRGVSPASKVFTYSKTGPSLAADYMVGGTPVMLTVGNGVAAAQAIPANPYLNQVLYGLGATSPALGGIMYDEAPEGTPSESTEGSAEEKSAEEASPKESTEKPAADNNTPEPKEPKDKKDWRDWLWERDPNKPRGTSKIGRNIKNWGVRVPLYSGIAAGTGDLIGNAVGAAGEEDSVKHEMTYPLLKGRFTIERGLLKMLGDGYKTKATEKPTQPMNRSLPKATPIPVLTPAQTSTLTSTLTPSLTPVLEQYQAPKKKPVYPRDSIQNVLRLLQQAGNIFN